MFKEMEPERAEAPLSTWFPLYSQFSRLQMRTHTLHVTWSLIEQVTTVQSMLLKGMWCTGVHTELSQTNEKVKQFYCIIQGNPKPHHVLYCNSASTHEQNTLFRTHGTGLHHSGTASFKHPVIEKDCLQISDTPQHECWVTGCAVWNTATRDSDLCRWVRKY